MAVLLLSVDGESSIRLSGDSLATAFCAVARKAEEEGKVLLTPSEAGLKLGTVERMVELKSPPGAVHGRVCVRLIQVAPEPVPSVAVLPEPVPSTGSA